MSNQKLLTWDPGTTGDKSKRAKAARPTKAQHVQRILEVIELLTMHADLNDMAVYSESNGWNVSRTTLKKYRKKAYQAIDKQMSRKIRQAVALHERQLKRLFTLALRKGELNLARIILLDKAAFLGLNEYQRKWSDAQHGNQEADRAGDALLAELQAALDELAQTTGAAGATVPATAPDAR